MRSVRRVAAVVALVGAVSGCSVYEDFTTSEFAKQDADAIVTAASKAMQDVTSMRLTGQVRSHGNQFFIDVTADRDDRCTGTVRFGRSHIDVRRMGDKVWLKGESGAYNRLSRVPLPAHTLRRLSSSWGLLDDDKALNKACDLDAFLEDFAVVDYGAEDDGKAGKKAGKQDDLSGEVDVTVGEETSMSGQKVVELSGSPGGQHQELSWVLSDAPHYVVKVESTSAQDGGSLSLSEFNEDVEVEAPDPKDVIRP